LIIKLTETKEELQQILTLQGKNHFENVTADKMQSDGFVTVKHDLDLLVKMNNRAKQIVAIENGKVVGYALVMLKEFDTLVPILSPMFRMIEKLEYNTKKLSSYNYYVMGQICIDESARRKGVFDALYEKHRETYSGLFEICLTEVSIRNSRSMKAHERVGFRTIHRFQDETDSWNILLWDWHLKSK
jgi:hypothetical protein